MTRRRLYLETQTRAVELLRLVAHTRTGHLFLLLVQVRN